MRLATKEQIVINVILGYYGDGTTCTIFGTHKTTPPGGSAAVASDCRLIYYGCYGVTFYLKISKLMSKKMKKF